MEQNPGFANSSKHYLSLVLSGQAALLQRGQQWAVAHELMMRALREAPTSVDTQSGLAKTPRQLARELQQALRAARRFELAESLNEALGQLPAAQEGGR
jgi:nitroimidazol reductase NimA-like FMN-containing flavoprotein (pyridoxamine 5'-phosphate oxidase superfamily)